MFGCLSAERVTTCFAVLLPVNDPRCTRRRWQWICSARPRSRKGNGSPGPGRCPFQSRLQRAGAPSADRTLRCERSAFRACHALGLVMDSAELMSNCHVLPSANCRWLMRCGVYPLKQRCAPSTTWARRCPASRSALCAACPHTSCPSSRSTSRGARAGCGTRHVSFHKLQMCKVLEMCL